MYKITIGGFLINLFSLNTSLKILQIYLIPLFIEKTNFYYNLIIIIIFNSLILIFKEILLIPFHLIKRRIKIFMAHSQLELKLAYKPPNYKIWYRYSAINKLILFTFTFGSFYPILYWITTFSLINIYLIDKFNLIKIYSKGDNLKDCYAKSSIKILTFGLIFKFLIFGLLRIYNLFLEFNDLTIIYNNIYLLFILISFILYFLYLTFQYLIPHFNLFNYLLFEKYRFAKFTSIENIQKFKNIKYYKPPLVPKHLAKYINNYKNAKFILEQTKPKINTIGDINLFSI
jgi:hypothetical protein